MTDINYTPEDLKNHDAIGVIIKNEKGQILMQDHVKFGFWTIPIGKAKPGRTPEDGMIEEMQEECNITPVVYKKIISRPYSYERNGKDVKVVLHIYEIISYLGKLENKEPKKHRSQVFRTLEDIQALDETSDATRLYLAKKK